MAWDDEIDAAVDHVREMADEVVHARGVMQVSRALACHDDAVTKLANIARRHAIQNNDSRLRGFGVGWTLAAVLVITLWAALSN